MHIEKIVFLKCIRIQIGGRMKLNRILILSIFFPVSLVLPFTNLKVGDKAPDFTMLLDNGQKIRLNFFLNKGNTIVLYFYPKDGTYGCTAQAENLRDNLDTLAKKNIVVFGISTDDLLSHQEFKKKHKLNFYLVSDYDRSISNLYGVMGYFGMAKRVTFIINSNGIIHSIIDDVDVKKHSEQILKALQTTSTL